MRHGNVSWCEVTGKDGGALQSFYGELFGWAFEPAPKMPEYGMVLRGDPAEGPGIGVSPAPEGPGWVTFYVQIDDLEATMAAAEARGGGESGEAATEDGDLGREPGVDLGRGEQVARRERRGQRGAGAHLQDLATAPLAGAVALTLVTSDDGVAAQAFVVGGAGEARDTQRAAKQVVVRNRTVSESEGLSADPTQKHLYRETENTNPRISCCSDHEIGQRAAAPRRELATQEGLGQGVGRCRPTDRPYRHQIQRFGEVESGAQSVRVPARHRVTAEASSVRLQG